MTREEAIDKLTRLCSPEQMNALKVLVPELAVSEDERIRKMLVEQMERWKKCAEDNNVVQDVKDASAAIAYLEKQKPILEVFGFKVGDAVRLKDGDGRKHIIKSFKEVKGLNGPNFYHVEFEDNSARDGIYPGKQYLKGYYTQMEKFEEEEWSEEDKKCLHTLIDYFGSEQTDIQECGKKAAINWLKSLPERFNLQPKQEWSKEDEERLKSIIHRTGVICGFSPFGEIKRDLDWLKSLPNRFSLKRTNVTVDSKLTYDENGEPELTQFEGALFSAFSDAWQEYMRGETVNVAHWAKEHSKELLEVAKEDSAEWSEEDKEIIGNLRHILNAYAFEHSGLDVNGDYIEQDYIDADNWLKSLRERVNLQPKREWSEEEKGILLECVSTLQNSSHWLLADKLSSLRPQPHWKPSKEQQMPDSTQLIAEWEKEKEVLEQKDFRGDAERMAYNAFLDGFVKGLGYEGTK